MFFDEVLAFDHVKKAIHIIITVGTRGPTNAVGYKDAVKRLDRLERKLYASVPKMQSRRVAGPLVLKRRTQHADFLRAVDKTKEYIAAGDVFQCVLSQRFDCKPGVDAFDIYRSLRIVNPSPYMYFLRFGLEGIREQGVGIRKTSGVSKKSAGASAPLRTASPNPYSLIPN